MFAPVLLIVQGTTLQTYHHDLLGQEDHNSVA